MNQEICGWAALVGGGTVAIVLLFIIGTAVYRGIESYTKVGTNEGTQYTGKTVRIGPNTLRTVVHCQTGKTFIINDRSGTMLDLGVKTECSTGP